MKRCRKGTLIEGPGGVGVPVFIEDYSGIGGRGGLMAFPPFVGCVWDLGEMQSLSDLVGSHALGICFPIAARISYRLAIPPLTTFTALTMVSHNLSLSEACFLFRNLQVNASANCGHNAIRLHSAKEPHLNRPHWCPLLIKS